MIKYSSQAMLPTDIEEVSSRRARRASVEELS